MAKALSFFLIIILAGCAHSPTGLCALGPHRPDPADRLSRGSMERVVLENEIGEEVCGWKP